LKKDVKKIHIIIMLRLDSAIRVLLVGFNFELEDAIKNVLENRDNISRDGHFTYAVIKSAEEGMFISNSEPEQIWFKYDNKLETYALLEERPTHLIGLKLP